MYESRTCTRREHRQCHKYLIRYLLSWFVNSGSGVANFPPTTTARFKFATASSRSGPNGNGEFNALVDSAHAARM